MKYNELQNLFDQCSHDINQKYFPKGQFRNNFDIQNSPITDEQLRINFQNLKNDIQAILDNQQNISMSQLNTINTNINSLKDQLENITNPDLQENCRALFNNINQEFNHLKALLYSMTKICEEFNPETIKIDGDNCLPPDKRRELYNAISNYVNISNELTPDEFKKYVEEKIIRKSNTKVFQKVLNALSLVAFFQLCSIWWYLPATIYMNNNRLDLRC